MWIFPAITAPRRKPASIRRDVFRLSMPVLLSSLFQRLVAIVDIFLTGGLGAAAIAATGLGQLLVFPWGGLCLALPPARRGAVDSHARGAPRYSR